MGGLKREIHKSELKEIVELKKISEIKISPMGLEQFGVSRGVMGVEDRFLESIQSEGQKGKD